MKYLICFNPEYIEYHCVTLMMRFLIHVINS
jgi:hypothetical protein